ncbi:MAG: tRNA (guanosine(46)-N7)-methyltransferase TrmB [Paludibacteraceae bacterium]|jgi:tRNA (guanine-N7-)-methyltransferase|nr:tRNA (guanosine(46)-N7)-methyltransferase TrmB [Paludibacteraceae bacterium]HOH96495.1 tRNA (guanosine(46)-N7)-methyltransferase TrmB [Candidatus Enterocola sp.]HPG54842.1 tRNA (guanosine(46)-N7)-methyltransferase TrmB [Candidatus Enterocola sp.]
MGKNKLQKFADMETFSHVFQYPFGKLQSGVVFPYKGKWNSFFGNDNPIVLELGCGKGEYTVGLARKYPNKNFIGIDIKGARIWTGAKDSNETGMKNVAFLRTNIELLNYFFASDEVSEIWITFPDPQMKKVRKRLTSTRFMQEYRAIMRKNGLLHLKTDSPFLYQYTLLMAQKNNLYIEQCTDDLYHTPNIDENLLSIQTYYEQQWLERGMNIKYIRLKLSSSAEWLEPDDIIEEDDYRSFNRSRRSANNQRTK